MTVAESGVCSDGKDSGSPRKEKQPRSYFILCMCTSEQLERGLSWESSLLLMIVSSFIYLCLSFETASNLPVSILGFFFFLMR